MTSSSARECGELVQRLLGRIPFGDLRDLPHRLGERPEGDAVAVGKAATAEDRDLALDRADQLVDEARLADARLPDDGRQPAAALLDRVAELTVELLELALAADHRRIEAPWPLGVLAHAHEPVRRHSLGLALQLERLDLLDVDVVAYEAVREVSQQDLLRAGGLLEARRDVDGVARDEPLARGWIASDDLPCVHARAHREADTPVTLELVVELGLRLLHVRRCSHCAQGVVLVHRRKAEHGHDRVADELLHDAAVLLELGAHRVEVARHHLAQRFGVELLSHCCRALEV